MSQARMALLRETPLGPYEVLALLGSGGMGEVHRARDTRLGREVAVLASGHTLVLCGAEASC